MENRLLAKQLPVIRLQVRVLYIPLRVLCQIANNRSNSRLLRTCLIHINRQYRNILSLFVVSAVAPDM